MKAKIILDIAKVIADPTVHNFTKQILVSAMAHDPVDALHDIELALKVWDDAVEDMIDDELTNQGVVL